MSAGLELGEIGAAVGLEFWKLVSVDELQNQLFEVRLRRGGTAPGPGAGIALLALRGLLLRSGGGVVLCHDLLGFIARLSEDLPPGRLRTWQRKIFATL